MINKRTTKDQMLELRRTKVCHPVHDGKEFGEGEEWFIPYTMRVPITCGRFAIMHHDVLAGAIGTDGTVVVNTDGWKSPSLRDAINTHLLPEGWEIKKDWFLVTPVDKYPVIDNMKVSPSGVLTYPTDEAVVAEWAEKLRTFPGKINYYIQHVFDLMKRDLIGRGHDESVKDSAALENQINTLLVSRHLLRQVRESFDVDIRKPSKELRDALDWYIRITLGLPFNV